MSEAMLEITYYLSMYLFIMDVVLVFAFALFGTWGLTSIFAMSAAVLALGMWGCKIQMKRDADLRRLLERD